MAGDASGLELPSVATGVGVGRSVPLEGKRGLGRRYQTELLEPVVVPDGHEVNSDRGLGAGATVLCVAWRQQHNTLPIH